MIIKGFEYRAHTEEEMLMVITILDNAGYSYVMDNDASRKRCVKTRAYDLFRSGYVYISIVGRKIYTCKCYGTSHAPEIRNLSEFFQKALFLEQPPTFKVQLSSNYVVEVGPGTVNLGDINISFNEVEMIHQAVEKMKAWNAEHFA